MTLRTLEIHNKTQSKMMKKKKLLDESLIDFVFKDIKVIILFYKNKNTKIFLCGRH
jgi:hypothetical protein